MCVRCDIVKEKLVCPLLGMLVEGLRKIRTYSNILGGISCFLETA